MRGTIKWFNPDKGFGWIALESGEEVYVHSSALPESLRAAGTEVELELVEGPGGKQAVRVKACEETSR